MTAENIHTAVTVKATTKANSVGWSSTFDPAHRKVRDGWGTRAFVVDWKCLLSIGGERQS
jgi:hypothetical protein